MKISQVQAKLTLCKPEDQTEEQPKSKAVFPNEIAEKPSFFETGVDIPPYLQTKPHKLKQGNDVVYNNVKDSQIYNIKESNEWTDSNEYASALKNANEFGKDGEGKTLLKNRRRINSKFYAHKIIGKCNYHGFKDFMSDYFQNRELEVMKDSNRINRIKLSRKFYQGRNSSS